MLKVAYTSVLTIVIYSTYTSIIYILFLSLESSTFPYIFAGTQAPEFCDSATIPLTCADKWMEFTQV